MRELVLIELDDSLAESLVGRFADRPDVRVIHGDILDHPLEAVFDDPSSVKVVGNIPYNITTPILFHLMRRPRPAEIVLMVQEEVADRIVAPPGTKTYGALSVSVRLIAEATKLFRVGRGAFRPVPGVDSAVLRVTPRRDSALTAEEESHARRLARAAFQWRRKQLAKILRDHPELTFSVSRIGVALDETGIRPTDRPEQLSPEDFLALARALGD